MVAVGAEEWMGQRHSAQKPSGRPRVGRVQRSWWGKGPQIKDAAERSIRAAFRRMLGSQIEDAAGRSIRVAFRRMLGSQIRGCGWEEPQSRLQEDTQTNLPAARTNFLQTHEGTTVSCFDNVRKARGYPGIDMSRLI